MSRGLRWILLIIARIIAEKVEEKERGRSQDAFRFGVSFPRMRIFASRFDLRIIERNWKPNEESSPHRSPCDWTITSEQLPARRLRTLSEAFRYFRRRLHVVRHYKVDSRRDSFITFRHARWFRSQQDARPRVRFIISEASLRACSPCELRFPERRGPNPSEEAARPFEAFRRVLLAESSPL